MHEMRLLAELIKSHLNENHGLITTKITKTTSTTNNHYNTNHKDHIMDKKKKTTKKHEDNQVENTSIHDCKKNKTNAGNNYKQVYQM